MSKAKSKSVPSPVVLTFEERKKLAEPRINKILVEFNVGLEIKSTLIMTDTKSEPVTKEKIEEKIQKPVTVEVKEKAKKDGKKE